MCKMVSFNNAGFVADIKLNHIINISKEAERCGNINRIMLFGSCIEERCTDESDIDIAVFGNKTRGQYIDSAEFRRFKHNLFQYDWNQDYDILYFRDKNENDIDILNDINKGVEIYKRG